MPNRQVVRWSMEERESKLFKVGLECGMWSDEEPRILTSQDGKKWKVCSSSVESVAEEGKRIQESWN